MPFIDVNRDGVNAKLLDPKLTAKDREFIHSQIRTYQNTREYVRVQDGWRIRELLEIPDSVEARA
jgi:hypothetical protein